MASSSMREESLKTQFQRLAAGQQTTPKGRAMAAQALGDIVSRLDGVDLRDMLPEIVAYVFSLGGWADDHRRLGFWASWHKSSGSGQHLVRLLGASGPLMQRLIRDSKDASLTVWPRWTEHDMPARVYRLHRNPRLAPFQEGTSRFLAMWQNPTVFEYYMICFAKSLVQRWADPSAPRPDTAVFFAVAQEYFNHFFCDPLEPRTPHEQYLAHQLWLIIVEVWLDVEQPPGVGLSRGQLTAVYRFISHVHLYSPFEPSSTVQYGHAGLGYAQLVRDMQGSMYQFLERALAVKEESRLWTAQRVWLAWIRPWRYRAKYYDQVCSRASNAGPADAEILRRLTAPGGGAPPDDVYSPEYQAFVRENIDCYSTLLHVWTERVAQVQYPVHIDVGSGAKAQERLNERDIKKAVLMALDSVLRVYADDRGLPAWTVDQVVNWLSDEGFARVARQVAFEYDRDAGYVLGEAVDGEKLDQICPVAVDQSGRPVLDDAACARFARLGLRDPREQDKLVGMVNDVRHRGVRPNPLLDELTAAFSETAPASGAGWGGNTSLAAVAAANAATSPMGAAGAGGAAIVRHWPLFEEKNPGPDRHKVVLRYHRNIEANLSRIYRNVLECLRQLEEPPRAHKKSSVGLYVFAGVCGGMILGLLLAIAFGVVALLASMLFCAVVGLLVWECKTTGSRLDQTMTQAFGRDWAGVTETAEDKRRRDMLEFRKHFVKVKGWCENLVPDINSSSDVSFVRSHAAGDPTGWGASPRPDIMARDVGYSTQDYDGPRMAKLIAAHRPWSQPCRTYESEVLVGLAYRLSFALNAALEKRPWHFVQLTAAVDRPPPARLKWAQLDGPLQEAAAALVEAHLRMSTGKQKQRSLWKFSVGRALRHRSGETLVDIEAVWDGEDFAFNDVTWADFEGRPGLQQLAHHLPAFEGLTWDQLAVREHLAAFGWTERAWDGAARAAAYLKDQARQLGKPLSSALRGSAVGGTRAHSPDQGFQNAVMTAGSLKPAVVNAAFVLLERHFEHEDGVVDTLYELQILDNLPGSRIVSCVLAESAMEKCTIDNESWFADPFELVHYHQSVPYCIEHGEAGRRTLYFLRAVEAVPDDVLGQARVAAQAALLPVNLRFFGSLVFYAQCALLYVLLVAVHNFLELGMGIDVDGDGDTDGSMYVDSAPHVGPPEGASWTTLVPFVLALVAFAAAVHRPVSKMISGAVP